MNLVIDVGNTLAKTAIFERGKIIHHQSFENINAGIVNDIIQRFPEINACISGSVRELPDNIRDIFPDSINSLILGADTLLPITHKYKTFDTLGAYRVAGVVAVNALYPEKDVLLIEMGTCITYVIVKPC